MTFYSLPFLCFLGITVLAYFLVPKRVQWVVLLAASYLFYFFNSKWLVLVLFGQTLLTFLIGLWIRSVKDRGRQELLEGKESLSKEAKKELKNKTKKRAKHVLLIGAVLNLGVLLVLKYSNFFLSNANAVLTNFGVTLPTVHFLLPLGISFYTLQALSYLIDVYRETIEPDRSLGKFMLFLSFFPQIVQGPIPRHAQLSEQLYNPHDFDLKRLERGAQLILWGWFKKLILAEYLSVPVAQLFSLDQTYTGSIVFFGAALYGIQVYADFSGGMDIARGVAQIFGIELVLNFKQPYFSTSVEDFWRRWHITLGSWMRDYVFYPLSLSKAFTALGRRCRKLFGTFAGKRIPAFLAMFIVYFLVGFWHGPNWKYIAYGIWNGIFIASGILLEKTYARTRERLGIPADSKLWHVFQILRTFCIITIGRYFSRAEGFKMALTMMARSTRGFFDFSWMRPEAMTTLGLDIPSWLVLLAAILILFFADFLHERNVEIRESIGRRNIVIRWAIYYAAILAILIVGIYGPKYNPAAFIYEQF